MSFKKILLKKSQNTSRHQKVTDKSLFHALGFLAIMEVQLKCVGISCGWVSLKYQSNNRMKFP